MALSADTVSSSVLFICLILATRVGHTWAHGHLHRKNHRVWFLVIWLAKSCDYNSQFVGLRSAHYNMCKRWSYSLVVHHVAARTWQAAVLLTVGRQSFLAYMISGCHYCFCIERGMYQRIVQQATLHITFRAVCNVLHCSKRMLWSPDVYILVNFLGVWSATLFTLRIHCRHPGSHTWLLLPCHLA
jgi:hypothetical protein